MDKISHDDIMGFAKFSIKFTYNLELFKFRLNKFLDLPRPSTTTEEECEWFTYYDILLVQTRAMLIESTSRTNNYTLQNYLKKLGREKDAQIIDNFLTSPFDPDIIDELGNEISIRNVIKFVTDKFICHYDYTRDEDILLENKISKILTNLDNYEKNNIHKIRCVIVELLKKLKNIDWSKIEDCKNIVLQLLSNSIFSIWLLFLFFI